MPTPAVAADRKSRGVCVECGVHPPGSGIARCEVCVVKARARSAGKVPSASLTYWGAREHSWRRQGIMVGDRFFLAKDYIWAWHRQHGRCGLCEKSLRVQRVHDGVGTGRGISVDHDHHSHQFRALVCTWCNIRISTLDLAWAKCVVVYLERHA